MKKILSIVLLLILMASLVFTACEEGEGEGEGEGEQEQVTWNYWDPETHGKVDFFQLEWMVWGESEPEPLYPFSNVGTVQFTFDEELYESLGDDLFWINVVIDTTDYDGTEQWAVQNLYVPYYHLDPWFGSVPSVQFSLGLDGETELPMLEAAVLVSSEPLEEQPQAEEFLTYTVNLVPYLTGGRNGDGSGSSTIPSSIEEWLGTISSPDRVSGILIGADSIVEINEEHMGCAPAAAARAIKYLDEIHGLNSTQDPQDMYDDLKEWMHTAICNEGTEDPNLLEGKIQYCQNKTLNINSQLVYTDTYEPGTGLPWDDIIEQVQDAIDAGGAVEILITGHVAFVTGVTRHADGSATISFVDDMPQGDGAASNKEHVITTDASGDFGIGNVDGFMIESVPD